MISCSLVASGAVVLSVTVDFVVAVHLMTLFGDLIPKSVVCFVGTGGLGGALSWTTDGSA